MNVNSTSRKPPEEERPSLGLKPIGHRNSDGRRTNRPVWKTDIRNKFDALSEGEERDLVYLGPAGLPLQVRISCKDGNCDLAVEFDGRVSTRENVTRRDLAWHLEAIWMEMIQR